MAHTRLERVALGSEPMWRHLTRHLTLRATVAPNIPDVLLMVVATILAVGGLVGSSIRSGGHPSSAAVALTLAQTLPLLFRRRWPLPVFVVVECAEALLLVTFLGDGPFSGLGLFIILYTVASVKERRVSLRCAGVATVVNALILLVYIALGNENALPSLFVVTAFVVGSWSLGDNIRTRRAYLAQLEERARRLEGEQAENARRAVQDERTRIARELHDVVAHHVSAIAVQAAAGAEIVEGNPQRAREIFGFIQETSRESLSEMRAMLYVLRSGDEIGADRAPQPSLAQVERLVNQSRAAGLLVSLQVEGAVRPLPQALDVSAYRILQEALTNSLKHAGSGPVFAHVLVRYSVDALELEVRDHGHGEPADLPHEGAGRGLIGMRERVALFHGELEAGPAPKQGFVVRVRLPLGETHR